MSIRKILIGLLVLFVALLISGEAYAGPVLKILCVKEGKDEEKVKSPVSRSGKSGFFNFEPRNNRISINEYQLLMSDAKG